MLIIEIVEMVDELITEIVEMVDGRDGRYCFLFTCENKASVPEVRV